MWILFLELKIMSSNYGWFQCWTSFFLITFLLLLSPQNSKAQNATNYPSEGPFHWSIYILLFQDPHISNLGSAPFYTLNPLNFLANYKPNTHVNLCHKLGIIYKKLDGWEYNLENSPSRNLFCFCSFEVVFWVFGN